ELVHACGRVRAGVVEWQKGAVQGVLVGGGLKQRDVFEDEVIGVVMNDLLGAAGKKRVDPVFAAGHAHAARAFESLLGVFSQAGRGRGAGEQYRGTEAFQQAAAVVYMRLNGVVFEIAQVHLNFSFIGGVGGVLWGGRYPAGSTIAPLLNTMSITDGEFIWFSVAGVADLKIIERSFINGSLLIHLKASVGRLL